MAGLNLRLRGAALREEERLWDFYQANQSDTLPVPSVGTIRAALENGSLLIVEDIDDNAIIATAGYFEYIKSVDGHIVFELAGTRVKTGRLIPVPLQQILLALRLFQIVSTEDQIRTRISVISSARHPRSKGNLVALGLTEIGPMPRWMDYDTYSWMPPHERNDWRHYVADCTCIDRALGILQQTGFEAGRLDCQSDRKRADDSTERIDVSMRYDLPIGALFAPLVQVRARNEVVCDLAPLPPTLPVNAARFARRG